MPVSKSTKKAPLFSRAQLARVIFRTMRIEEPSMTQALADKAAKKVKIRS